MYRTCIFCSADLGENRVVEPFPVGRSLAFDGWKGRLWAVCPKCARWNLAPLEERWEAVETAEKLFVDSRLRVQSENIGLCRLPDGTRLIRVGRALPGELAAWRYGDTLLRRRRRYLIGGGAAAVAGLVLVGGTLAAGIGGGLYSLISVFGQAWESKQAQRVIHRIPPVFPGGALEIVIRRWHVQGAQLGIGAEDGGLELRIPDWDRDRRRSDGWGRVVYGDSVLALRGDDARMVLGRAMVHVNSKGASRGRVADAVGLLQGARSAEQYLRDAAERGSVLGKRRDMADRRLSPVAALALEMALHEEQERRALEGELAGLEAAWRQAEEIAAIADALPDHVPPPEPPRMVLPAGPRAG